MVFLPAAKRCQGRANGEERQEQSCLAQPLEKAEDSHAAKRSHVEPEQLFQHFPLAKVTASAPLAN